MANPEEFIPEFPSQRETEQIELILFKHWYFLVMPIIQSLVVITVSFVIPLWLKGFSWIFSYGLTALLYYGWLAGWVIYMLVKYLSWYRNRYIITSERIIDIDQQGLFNRKVSEVELTRIQNITHSVKGIFATMLDFGTVVVQSAGANDLTLDQIAYPANIQEEITKLVKSAASHKSVTAEDLIDFIKTKRD